MRDVTSLGNEWNSGANRSELLGAFHSYFNALNQGQNQNEIQNLEQEVIALCTSQNVAKLNEGERSAIWESFIGMTALPCMDGDSAQWQSVLRVAERYTDEYLPYRTSIDIAKMLEAMFGDGDVDPSDPHFELYQLFGLVVQEAQKDEPKDTAPPNVEIK